MGWLRGLHEFVVWPRDLAHGKYSTNVAYYLLEGYCKF